MIKSEKGSVLMEFIIVLPIYMLLIGFAFVTGELSLETIHLAGSADRTLALTQEAGSTDEPEAFKKYRLSASPDREAWANGSETEFSYAGDGGGLETTSRYRLNDNKSKDEPPVFVSDKDFRGPWVEMTAAKVEDDYMLPPWTRGMVAFWFRQDFQTTDGVQKLDGTAKELLGGSGDGRTTVRGKNLEATTGSANWKYGFYTLRRHAGGRVSYRTWGCGKLVASDNWKTFVYGEMFPSEGGTSRASSHTGIDGGDQKGSAPVGNAGDASVYCRNSDFMKWSN